MKIKDLILGNCYSNVLCENFLDPETGRIRVRPLPDQGLPTSILIECSKIEREKYPLGTRFSTIDVRVCIKPNGRKYLRAKHQMIIKLDE